MPGTVFAAGVHFNNRITWWNRAKSFTDYLARCQYMLRRGHFVADVLYYEGDLVPCFVSPKNIDPDRGFGYDYDVCNTEIIMSRLSVRDGRIYLPDGMNYQVLVLPESGIVPIEVARKILELVQEGATVIGPRFTKTPGLKNFPESEKTLREITEKLILESGRWFFLLSKSFFNQWFQNNYTYGTSSIPGHFCCFPETDI